MVTCISLVHHDAGGDPPTECVREPSSVPHSLLIAACRTFASSIPTGIITDLERQFTFSAEVGTLTISMFVVGYCVGPLVWGPLSEYVGRKPVFLGTFVVYTGMQIGCALAPNTAALLIFRFIGGTFAAAPLANSGYVLLSSIYYLGCG